MCAGRRAAAPRARGGCGKRAWSTSMMAGRWDRTSIAAAACRRIAGGSRWLFGVDAMRSTAARRHRCFSSSNPALGVPTDCAKDRHRGSTRHILSVAPMMKVTNRHQRVMMRALTKRTLLYTEMVTANAVVHGNRERLLGFSAVEHPVALQLGGDDPTMLSEAARIGQDFGYDEINLNVGCPSPRVKSGNFGACLMLQPEVVERAVQAMRHAVSIPVTVKHRLGVDDMDSEADLTHFVDVVSRAPADRLIVHARKALLQGLSPKQNREVPPLRYDAVWRLKEARPELLIEINGGITTLQQAEELLQKPNTGNALTVSGMDGVMIGRAARDDPWIFADADRRLYGEPRNPCRTREEAVRSLLPYAENLLIQGEPLHRLTRHMHGALAVSS
eukprot:COSAG02_NODE_1690_length_11299_cov_21.781071_7_plen_389_part_00